jgi:hypothetical protein
MAAVVPESLAQRDLLPAEHLVDKDYTDANEQGEDWLRALIHQESDLT